jgi:hypothetical protein
VLALRIDEDGSFLLQPIRVAAEAQRGFDFNPELRDLLARAASPALIRRPRRRR